MKEPEKNAVALRQIPAEEQCRRPRHRLLLSAYAISPGRGSEPGVGWHRALYAAAEYDTWVLSRSQEFEKPIRKWLAANGEISGLRFCFIKLTRIEERLNRIPAFRYFVYNLWQRRAFRFAIDLHRQFRFDLVHHVTMCGFREPGYLWRLGPPFIWGPIGGTQDYPAAFLLSAGARGAISEGFRTLMNRIQLLHSGRVRKAIKNSTVLIAANSQGVKDFKKYFGVDVFRLPDVGIERIHPRVKKSEPKSRPLRILWSGRLEHRKALFILLLALGRVRESVRFDLRILGDGPLRKRWRKIAEREKVADNCTWLGNIPLEEVSEQYDWADVFVFTSLRDTFGTVVLEALSHGLPVICFDQGGAGDAVVKSCGVKISATNPSDAIHSFAETIKKLSTDPDWRERLSLGAQDRAKDYLWAENSRQLMKLFRPASDARDQNARSGAPKDDF